MGDESSFDDQVGCGLSETSGEAVREYAETMGDDNGTAADSPPVWTVPVCISYARDGEREAR